jgi:hypothetical protein
MTRAGAGCGNAVSAGFFSGENLAAQHAVSRAGDYESGSTLAQLVDCLGDCCHGVHVGDVDHGHQRTDGIVTSVETID